jgi:hypothetical protein
MGKIFIAFGLMSSFFLASCSGDSSSPNFTLKGATTSTGLAATLASTSASSLKIKLYKFAVSTNADCSNPTVVYTNDNPDYADMAGQATFGTATVADNTYPCVILEMSDVVRFVPSGTDATCTQGTSYDNDICPAGGSMASSTLIDGTAVTCTGDQTTPSENRIALYMTTISTHDGGSGEEGSNPHAPPAAGASTTANGLKLGSALVVSGSKTAYFVIDPTGQVSGSDGSCFLDAPAFSFVTP